MKDRIRLKSRKVTQHRTKKDEVKTVKERENERKKIEKIKAKT